MIKFQEEMLNVAVAILIIYQCHDDDDEGKCWQVIPYDLEKCSFLYYDGQVIS